MERQKSMQRKRIQIIKTKTDHLNQSNVWNKILTDIFSSKLFENLIFALR